MKRLISFPLEGGGSVRLEVEEKAGPAVTRGLHPSDVIETVANSFEATLGAIKPAAIAVASISDQAGGGRSGEHFSEHCGRSGRRRGRVRRKICRTGESVHRLRQHRGAVPGQGGVAEQEVDIV